jgi:cytochrome c-type biogenesis protein CcmE
MRLIGVTGLIVVIIGGIIFYTTREGAGAGAMYATISEVLADESLVGEKVKVSGAVVAGSWDQGTRPMVFDIVDPAVGGEPYLEIVYDGTVPTAFGDGTGVIVTGELTEDLTIEADQMITQCPSKYESAEGALSVDALLESGDSVVGKPVKVSGVVADDSLGMDGFVLESDSDSGMTVEVLFDEALPENVNEGSSVVLGGSLDDQGVFTATSVAESE